MMRALLATAALAALLAGCAEAPPKVAPTPPPAAPPPPAPPPPPPPADWRDQPLTPGNWSYARTASGSEARFGSGGGAPLLVFRCDRSARMIRIAVTGATVGSMTITTSYSGRAWPMAVDASGHPVASVPAADPFLDRIAFSRGRVSYAVPGQPLLMLPAWAEPARVIEDCRG